MTREKASVVLSILAVCVSLHASASVYRVGPEEKFSTISQVATRLAPGDIVEITGDVTDSAILIRDGSDTRPITVRGVLRPEGGRLVKPRISLAGGGLIALWCQGDWNIIENLDFDGKIDRAGKQTIGVYHDCKSLLVRNCRFQHFEYKGITGTASAGSITVEFCEFESCGSMTDNGKTVDVWSWTPGSVMRVEHCYFHDALGQCHLKTHCPRNIIRYNWFENAYKESINITDRIVELCPTRPDGSYPMHSDIVGNVFIQGSSPGSRYSTLSTGGHGTDEPGPEGDFNIAHNLFVEDVFGSSSDPPVFDLVQGNVDHVKMYNNVFLQMGGRACLVYLRDLNWDTPETREFIERRGSPDPIVEGSNNWIFERSIGIPESFKSTLRGLNPKFVDLLNGDYRPRKDSPLAGAGMWPLPKGQIVDLVPEYEPQRGIPADLKPKPRRKVVPPSIGPFEAPDEPEKSPMN